MKTRKLGSSGIDVSLVGLGCNNFGMTLDEAGSRNVIDAAIDHGITLFDTADVYGGAAGAGTSETFMGRILGVRRKKIILATKFGHKFSEEKQGARAAYIKSAVEDSLKRLQTDYIDLYQLHKPDTKTPMEETLGALNDLVKAGKVRAIGCSNLDAAGIRDANAISKKNNWTRYESAQDEYSLLFRKPEDGLLQTLQAENMGLLPYFPLASGLLTGKYSKDTAAGSDTRFGKMKALGDRYATDENWCIVAALKEFCAKRNHTMTELAFSWLASKPVVSSVIAGATRPEQIAQNVKAADWDLSSADLTEIEAILKNN